MHTNKHTCIQTFADRSNSKKPGAHWPVIDKPGLKLITYAAKNFCDFKLHKHWHILNLFNKGILPIYVISQYTVQDVLMCYYSLFSYSTLDL